MQHSLLHIAPQCCIQVYTWLVSPFLVCHSPAFTLTHSSTVLHSLLHIAPQCCCIQVYTWLVSPILVCHSAAFTLIHSSTVLHSSVYLASVTVPCVPQCSTRAYSHLVSCSSCTTVPRLSWCQLSCCTTAQLCGLHFILPAPPHGSQNT